MKTRSVDREAIQNDDRVRVEARQHHARFGQFAFGPFVLDEAERTLLENGRRCAIQPQPLRVLALLAARPSRVTTREELRREIWGDDFAVDYEHGLNFAIHQIRSVLGDSAKSPRYVETVPRVGYRFIANVDRIESPTDLVAAPKDPSQAPPAPRSDSIDAERAGSHHVPESAERSRPFLALVVGLALVATMALHAAWQRRDRAGCDVV